jgi:hypothetical protein
MDDAGGRNAVLDEGRRDRYVVATSHVISYRAPASMAAFSFASSLTRVLIQFFISSVKHFSTVRLTVCIDFSTYRRVAQFEKEGE